LLFIFAATGSAVGLGNIWKFPWMTAESGGGAFVLIYILSVIFLALPIMCAEILIGKRGKQNPVNTLRTLSTEASYYTRDETDLSLNRTVKVKKQFENNDLFSNWELVGWMGIAAGVLILSFYSVIAGWTLSYIIKSITGSFVLITATGSTAKFEAFISDPEKLILWHTLFMILTCYIVSKGIKSGIEKAIKFLIPGLFILLIGLAAHASTLSGFSDAMSYLFVADFDKINNTVILSAMSMAFFSLSIGMGSLMVYGSYLPEDTSIFQVSSAVAFSDTLVAILAGIIIFPIVFTYDLDPNSAGPGLIFQTLPIAFGAMDFGTLIATLFFILLFFAAITSSISLIEPAITFVVEKFSLSRVYATNILGVFTWTLGILTVLSFNELSSFKVFGMTIFDNIDYLTSKIMLPLGGLLMALFAGFIMKRAIVISELNSNTILANIWFILLKIFSPILLIIIFVNGII
jgi:NSS family neurotransmitter:Na+ symporter|tara:strand:+ start:87 stop:1472 length:1386 start_codon:yes stop_codon:yes gene_type:complete